MSTEIQKFSPELFSPIQDKMREAGFSIEDVKREISFAVQHINRNPQLQKCTQVSLLGAVMNVANIGLSLNPAAKESYIVPRYNSVSQQMEATLEPSYIGLVKLLTDSGSVTAITCQMVYANDDFSMDLADNQNPVKHRVNPIRERGDAVGVYAVATMPSGYRQAEYMSLIEINDIRDRSESYKAFKAGKIKSAVWESDYSEMCRKTVIKRIYKYLPRTERMHQIDRAIKQDNTDYMATDDQIDYIIRLLGSSSLDQVQRDDIELETTVMSAERASQVIQQLKANQLDPITQGRAYGQKQIAEHLSHK